MLIVNGKSYQHTTFGYIDDEKIMCEMVNMNREEAISVFCCEPEIIFVNKDGVQSKLRENHFGGFLDEAEEGNVRVVLKK